jgi:two-component system nitrate/nitrite response regulator NarL
MQVPPDGVKIRVVLVDRFRIVLWALKKLIDEAQTGMEVVAMASDCASAVEFADKSEADVVVLDSDLVVGESYPAEIHTLASGRSPRVLIYSGDRDSGLHQHAILRGACGVVHKGDEPEVLLKAIAKVHEGQLWLDRSTTGRIFVELSRQKSDPAAVLIKQKLNSLTEREHDVVRTLVNVPGADNKKLADRLHIGEHTLRNHLSRIYDKLGVPNRLELYVFAQRHGLSGPTL